MNKVLNIGKIILKEALYVVLIWLLWWISTLLFEFSAQYWLMIPEASNTLGLPINKVKILSIHTYHPILLLFYAYWIAKRYQFKWIKKFNTIVIISTFIDLIYSIYMYKSFYIVVFREVFVLSYALCLNIFQPLGHMLTAIKEKSSIDRYHKFISTWGCILIPNIITYIVYLITASADRSFNNTHKSFIYTYNDLVILNQLLLIGIAYYYTRKRRRMLNIYLFSYILANAVIVIMRYKADQELVRICLFCGYTLSKPAILLFTYKFLTSKRLKRMMSFVK